MLLRPYQEDALAKIQAVYRSGRRRALLVAPTGSGKSAMVSYMLERSNKLTLILCHRGEILDQIAGSMTVPFGIIGGQRGTPMERIHIGMVQTVVRRLDTLPKYQWVASDEAHLAMSPTWRAVLAHYADAWHLGMSASPCRLDGIGLGAEYERIVYGPSIRELTERGYLVPCRVFAPTIEARVARNETGPENLTAAAEEIDRPTIIGDVIGHFRRIAGARQAIVFCCTRQHADHVASDFSRAGIPAVAVDGSMPKGEQKQKIEAFRARRVQALVNVDLLTTGFDCPQIEVGVFLRPTQSLALYLQMVGRILRIFPGKPDAVLLDHVGNVMRFGMPDEDREWTLDGRLKRVNATPVAQCPKCYAAHRPAPRCPSCDHVYASAPTKRVMAERDGVLEEIDAERLRWLREQKLHVLLEAAKTRDDLEEIRRARRYHPRWTTIQMEIRAGRRPSRWAA
jgi:superfamily II DNA or RNA helicase